MSNLLIIDAKETVDGALFIGYGDSYYSNYMIVGINDVELDPDASDETNGKTLKDYVIKHGSSEEIIDGINNGEIDGCQISLTTNDIEIDEYVIEFY